MIKTSQKYNNLFTETRHVAFISKKDSRRKLIEMNGVKQVLATKQIQKPDV